MCRKREGHLGQNAEEQLMKWDTVCGSEESTNNKTNSKENKIWEKEGLSALLS